MLVQDRFLYLIVTRNKLTVHEHQQLRSFSKKSTKGQKSFHNKKNLKQFSCVFRSFVLYCCESSMDFTILRRNFSYRCCSAKREPGLVSNPGPTLCQGGSLTTKLRLAPDLATPHFCSSNLATPHP
jgi:hypothetical protein